MSDAATPEKPTMPPLTVPVSGHEPPPAAPEPEAEPVTEPAAPAEEKPADPPAAEPEGDEEVDDFSDVFDFGEDDEDEGEEPEPASKPAAKAKPEKAEPEPEPDEEIDFSDEDAVRAAFKAQKDRLDALEKRQNEREASEKQAAIEQRIEALGDDIDANIKQFAMTKPEIRSVLKYVRDKGLEPNLLSGRMAFSEVVGFARPDVAARVKTAPPPAPREPAGGSTPKPPAAKPKAPAAPTPASFAEASAQARTEFAGRLTKS